MDSTIASSNSSYSLYSPKPWHIGQRIMISTISMNGKSQLASIRDYDCMNKKTHLWFLNTGNFENINLSELAPKKWRLCKKDCLISEYMEFVPEVDWIPTKYPMRQVVQVKFDGIIGAGLNYIAFIDSYDPISRMHHVHYGDTTEWIWATKERITIIKKKNEKNWDLEPQLVDALETYDSKHNNNKNENNRIAPQFDPIPYGLDDSFIQMSKQIDINFNKNRKTNKKHKNKKQIQNTISSTDLAIFTNKTKNRIKKRKRHLLKKTDYGQIPVDFVKTSPLATKKMKRKLSMQHYDNHGSPNKRKRISLIMDTDSDSDVDGDDGAAVIDLKVNNNTNHSNNNNSSNNGKSEYPRSVMLLGIEWNRRYCSKNKRYYWESEKKGKISKSWDPWRLLNKKAPWMSKMQNWYKFKDENTKKFYYYNYASKESTYQKPKYYLSDQDIYVDSADEQNH